MVDDERLEQVARALCVADGYEPDERVPSNTMHLVEAEFGITVNTPAWTNYVAEARRFMAAATALGLLK